jgi:hypothetical protein
MIYKLNSLNEQINCYTFQLRSFLVLLDDKPFWMTWNCNWSPNHWISIIQMNFSNVFFDVESESEICFFLTITVFALEGVVIILSNPVLIIKLNLILNFHEFFDKITFLRIFECNKLLKSINNQIKTIYVRHLREIRQELLIL